MKYDVNSGNLELYPLPTKIPVILFYWDRLQDV